MTLKLSTGLRNNMLSVGPLKDALATGEIRIYSGTEPASADDSIGGSDILCVIRAGGATPLTWNASASGGVLSKNSGETWSGTVLISGLATYYRHVSTSDTNAASTVASRIQGSIGLSGADMNLGNPQLVALATQGLSAYSVALPAA